MKKITCLLILLFLSLNHYSQCPQGVVYLYSQNDVDNYLKDFPNCKNISGAIYFRGNTGEFPIVNFDAFKNITSITGLIFFEKFSNSNMPNFSGLENIETINGSLIFEDNSISNINLLNNLKHISNEFRLSNNQIQKIDGFEKLESIRGKLIFENNQNLEEIPIFTNLTVIGSISKTPTNEIIINFRNNKIKNLKGFNKVTEINGQIHITGNVDLEFISGFNSLKNLNYNIFISTGSVNEIKITGFNELTILNNGISLTGNFTDLSGFDKLEFAEYIFLSGVIKDTDFAAFNNLIESKQINIYSNNFNTINSFNNLKKIYEISFNNNSGLKNILGFSKLEEVKIFSIFQEPDLETISTFNSITSEIEIFRVSSNPKLISINGFNGVLKINDWMEIQYNNNLNEVVGFNGLISSIGLINISSNSSLKKIDGFYKTENLNQLNIQYNSLDSIIGFNDLNSINYISIIDNKLSDINGFNKLKRIEKSLFLAQTLLTDLNFLLPLEYIGEQLVISYNKFLVDFKGLSKITSNDLIFLEIEENQKLENLDGLESIKGSIQSLRIVNNPELKSIASLKNITSINNIDLRYNEKLESLNGFEGLKGYLNYLTITNNGSLESIEPLKNLDGIINNLEITYNSNLSFCTINPICDWISKNNYAYILYNKPECSNSELISSCSSLGIEKNIDDFNLIAFPNPFNDFIYLNDSFNEFELFDLTGKSVLKATNKSKIETSRLSKGLYFLKYTNNSKDIQKIIKLIKN